MWDTRPDKVRAPRGLDFASQDKTKKGFNQKRQHQIHIWSQFSGFWWMAEEGKGRGNREEESGS